MRGAGDFFGEKQHGLPPLKVADIVGDRQLLSQAQAAAKKMFDESPDMAKYPLMNARIEKMFSKNAEDGMN